MSIELEPGRLALRRPELGGFLMVEVVARWEEYPEGQWWIAWEPENDANEGREGDFLPVLRAGDVVLAGSLLYDIAFNDAYEATEPYEKCRNGQRARYALLRYGPDTVEEKGKTLAGTICDECGPEHDGLCRCPDTTECGDE